MSSALILAGCDGGHGMMGGYQASPETFASNGERIYFTGTSDSGNAITYTGGNVHLQMMGGGCAICHGADRGGRRVMPQFWIVAPPLTQEALYGNHEEFTGHGEHERYDPASLRRAISRGVDPAGAPLDTTMPRWSMSEGDWSDLLAYLGA